MAATGRDAQSAFAREVARTVRDAGLVELTTAASGDALAATATLARALAATGTPFQASVTDTLGTEERATDADVTVAVGADAPTADLALAGPGSASTVAFAVATELDQAPDPVVALAGTVAAGGLDEQIAAAVERAGIDRRPGVAVPTAELADGLAHSTLVHAPFSGDVEAAREALAELSLPEDAGQADLAEDDRRRVASLVALAAGGDDATDRTAWAVERALRPYEGGPVGTVGGYADVLDATARTRPGVGLSLALGDDSGREPALDVWRTNARRVHESVRTCETARYDGLVIARCADAPVATVARLLAEFRTPEPTVLAVDDGEAAAHVADRATESTAGGADVATALAAAAEAADGEAIGTDRRARARFGGDAGDLIAAFREAR